MSEQKQPDYLKISHELNMRYGIPKTDIGLDRPELREIENALRLYHACMSQDPRGTASQKVGIEHRKQCLIKARSEILALIPDIEEAKGQERKRIGKAVYEDTNNGELPLSLSLHNILLDYYRQALKGE